MEKIFKTYNKDEVVLLDEGRGERCEVKVISQTLHNMYTKIKSADDSGKSWEVVTNRLTPLK